MTDPAERFTAVFRQYHPRILAYARRRVDEVAAGDIVAETFLAAWRHIGQLPEEPLPWLYRTAAHCLANHLRAARRQVRLADRMAQVPAAAFVTADHAERVLDTGRLGAALDRLSSRDREALLLVAWEDLDQSAAAYVMGCSAAAFRVRLHRARRRVARLLAGVTAPTTIHTVTVEEI